MRVLDKTLNKIFLEDNLSSLINSVVNRLSDIDRVVVGCDPSKTGYGICFGDIYGNELVVLELQAPGENNLILIDSLYDFLYSLWTKLNIDIIGYEEVIHIDPTSKSQAYSFNVRNTLSEIRCISRLAGIKATNKNPDKIISINNEVWKSAIIGSYNKKGIKGSKTFLQSENPKYASYSDNMTDAICIYRYLVKLMYKNNLWSPSEHSKAVDFNNKDYLIGSIDMNDSRLKDNCTYNYKLSLDENLARMLYKNDKYVSFTMSLNLISISDFYILDLKREHITDNGSVRIAVIRK